MNGDGVRGRCRRVAESAASRAEASARCSRGPRGASGARGGGDNPAIPKSTADVIDRGTPTKIDSSAPGTNLITPGKFLSPQCVE